jgi:hypothetical protein
LQWGKKMNDTQKRAKTRWLPRPGNEKVSCLFSKVLTSCAPANKVVAVGDSSELPQFFDENGKVQANVIK